jgi:putative glutamine amidotransferase
MPPTNQVGHRPLIGVSVGHIEANGRTIDGTQREYGDRVGDAGGMPVELPARPGSPARELLSRLDGLLFTGGGDVSPARYGATPVSQVAGVDDERDSSEVALVVEALAMGLPVLAVCRGVQILNVALGGTLVQHLPDVTSQPHLVVDHKREPVHTVRLEPDSLLGRIIGTPSLGVNSLHHQAVDQVGTGLRPVGWAEDGIIEALEHDSGRAIGVQWHPELLPDIAEHRRLFAWLVDQAATAGRPVPSISAP